MNYSKKSSVKSLVILMILIVILFCCPFAFAAGAETFEGPDDSFLDEEIDETDWGDAYVILEDPQFFMVDAEEDMFPVISPPLSRALIWPAVSALLMRH